MFFPVFSVDPYYSLDKLLLPLTGNNNSTTFTDISTSNRVIAWSGNVKISTNQSKWGAGSAYFDGSADRLACTGVAIGTQDFTIDFWMYPINGGGQDKAVLFQTGAENTNGGLHIWRDGSTNPMQITVSTYSSSSYRTAVSSTTTFDNDTWAHVRVSRSGTTYYLYKNGTLLNSNTQTLGSNLTLTAWRIGVGDYGLSSFNGYLQDIRVTVGVARSTSGDYAVPTSQLSAGADTKLNMFHDMNFMSPSFVSRLGL